MGAKVVCVDVDGAGCAETAEAINRDGGTAVSYEADVTDRHRIAAVHAAVTSGLGPVDILVNNAGLVTAHMYVNPESDRLVEDLVNVNLLGQIWVSRVFITASLLPRDWGGPRVQGVPEKLFYTRIYVNKWIINILIAKLNISIFEFV